MSEYLIKKALLEWLNENIKDQDWPYEIRYAFKHVREKIQSSAFDADNTEIQRLREALGHIGWPPDSGSMGKGEYPATVGRRTCWEDRHGI